MSERINHPPHYGGESNPYEAIKIIEALNLNFNLGNTVKYISRADKKGAPLDDLRKAQWYLQREITNRERLEKTSPGEGLSRTGGGSISRDSPVIAKE